ncbi:MAG: ATP-dependent Clp protease ATP-binding subunit [Erysipelotrichaceae bacterium]|nr:ATP-dependent Clp protease ATP-binding subunit [Erysipelotrichaceae bacterium]
MLNKFQDKTQKIIALSESIAFDLGQSSVGSEHLLLAILKSKDNKLKSLLEKEGIFFEEAKDEIIALFGKKSNKPFYMEYSIAYKTILENALAFSRKKGEDKVSIDSLSVALLEYKECVAVELLDKHTTKRLEIIDELKKQVKKNSELDAIFDLTNLNAKALKHEPILIHREKECNLLIEILLRKQKQNAIIIGDPGVGKTALVEYLAHLINKNQVPLALKDKTIYELDIASIIAGTKYRGEFEEKLKKILKKVKEDKNAIVFIDEIHNIIGAGGAEGAIDASNIIKPYLSRGDICCIGATTYDEYVKLFEKEKALERRFQIVRLEEPLVSQTIDILLALKNDFIKYHKIKINDQTIKDIVHLCDQYVFERKFPDKAIDVMDMACVRCKNEKKEELDKDSIIEVIETNYNVKIEVLNKAQSLQESLNNVLLGQEDAIKNICNHIRCIELGIHDENRPLGVFLFIGATGVGKTETTKQIAKHYFGSEKKYIKLDMSEYSETASVTKLIGSPPGYVGFEKQSLLVDHIRNNPHSVVVLDEVEKAHIDVLDVFLNVFDEGYFFDSSKRKIDFTNSIIIMTSNLGFSEEMFHKNKIGYIDNKQQKEDILQVIQRHFRPEFINRIDDIIFFDNLNDKVCKNLISRYIDEYQKKVSVELSKEQIINNIVLDNETLRYGARGIKRKVKKEILKQFQIN